MYVLSTLNLQILTISVQFGPKVMYTDGHSLLDALRGAFKDGKHVKFHGAYTLPVDPLVSDKDRIRMTTHNIWKVTGYRFT